MQKMIEIEEYYFIRHSFVLVWIALGIGTIAILVTNAVSSAYESVIPSSQGIMSMADYLLYMGSGLLFLAAICFLFLLGGINLGYGLVRRNQEVTCCHE